MRECRDEYHDAGTLTNRRRGQNTRAAVRTGVSALALVLAFSIVASALPGSEPQVSKVEPPNWWVGFQPSVMVLLYGDNLAGANISVNYPGASVTKVEAQPDGKHAFVWLKLDPGTRPGDIGINIKTPSGATRVNSSAATALIAAGQVSGNHARRCYLPDHA